MRLHLLLATTFFVAVFGARPQPFEVIRFRTNDPSKADATAVFGLRKSPGNQVAIRVRENNLRRFNWLSKLISSRARPPTMVDSIYLVPERTLSEQDRKKWRRGGSIHEFRRIHGMASVLQSANVEEVEHSRVNVGFGKTSIYDVIVDLSLASMTKEDVVHAVFIVIRSKECKRCKRSVYLMPGFRVVFDAGVAARPFTTKQMRNDTPQDEVLHSTFWNRLYYHFFVSKKSVIESEKKAYYDAMHQAWALKNDHDVEKGSSSSSRKSLAAARTRFKQYVYKKAEGTTHKILDKLHATSAQVVDNRAEHRIKGVFSEEFWSQKGYGGKALKDIQFEMKVFGKSLEVSNFRMARILQPSYAKARIKRHGLNVYIQNIIMSLVFDSKLYENGNLLEEDNVKFDLNHVSFDLELKYHKQDDPNDPISLYVNHIDISLPKCPKLRSCMNRLNAARYHNYVYKLTSMSDGLLYLVLRPWIEKQLETIVQEQFSIIDDKIDEESIRHYIAPFIGDNE